MRISVDIEGHESVDIVIDMRKIHEGGSMEDSNHSTNHIFLQLWTANLPEFAVFFVHMHFVAEGMPRYSGENLQHCYKPLLIMIIPIIIHLFSPLLLVPLVLLLLLIGLHPRPASGPRSPDNQLDFWLVSMRPSDDCSLQGLSHLETHL